MRDRALTTSFVRLVAAASLACAVLASCSDDGDADGAAAADGVASLAELLPPDARGALAVDFASLRAGDSAGDLTTLVEGEGSDPAFGELFASFGSLTDAVDVPRVATTALLAQTVDASDGTLLLAQVESESLADVVDGDVPTSVGTYGSSDQELYRDASGNDLALLPGGLLVVGGARAVESVLDVANGTEPSEASAIAPFLEVLADGTPIGFAYGLPALFDDGVAADLTLEGAAVVSGALDLVDGAIGGTVAFHTANASAFVEAFNALNRNATDGEDPTEQPLTVAPPIADDLSQVVVTLPASPIDGSPDDVRASRNLVKKLFVGMQAHDDAEGVGDGGNAALVDLLVKSEADADTPPSPGSVFIRWEFRDEAAIEAFEANELPEGFTLARTQFLESDDPEGEYFLALNLYNSGGGSIVSGMRAEWDVFVDPPEGADPDAGERPRFMIVDALGEAVSADPINLVTPAEPLSHEFAGDVVQTSVRRSEEGREVPVFASSFPKPDPEAAEVARFTREMAIGNDYIYWPNGVYDRVLYNATTFNHDAYFVDPAEVTISDDSRWSQYLKPTVKDVVYYVNTLEYVASPMANLDSDHLDVTPAWLAELDGFKNNGHQLAFMRGAVKQLFLGESDALVSRRIGNETPAASYSFDITDPDALSAALDLPDGSSLAPTKLTEAGDEGYYLTASVFEVDDALEGTRAEWSVTVDDGSGRPHRVVLEAMTAEVGIDPVSIIDLPSGVDHQLADGVLSTTLSSEAITFDASFGIAEASDDDLTLDWIEAGDRVCSTNDICDEVFYDAETLDVPVHQPAEVAVDAFDTPWNEFVRAEPAVVYFQDNAQEYAVKRWQNLKVPVEELPVSGMEDGTHSISGSGSLVGRASDIVDSDYTYRGDALVDGDQLTFAIDQQVENALGTSNIYTSGTFDLATGTGTQTVVDCRGPDLMCSGIVGGSTALYTAQDLDASDRDAISWKVDIVIDLGGSFGTADSASTFLATRAD